MYYLIGIAIAVVVLTVLTVWVTCSGLTGEKRAKKRFQAILVSTIFSIPIIFCTGKFIQGRAMTQFGLTSDEAYTVLGEPFTKNGTWQVLIEDESGTVRYYAIKQRPPKRFTCTVDATGKMVFALYPLKKSETSDSKSPTLTE